MNLLELEDIIRKNDLLKKYDLLKIGVFGSVLHSESPNDIDLFFEGDQDLAKLAGFKSELERITGKTVDVVIEQYASPIIIYRARKEMKYVA